MQKHTKNEYRKPLPVQDVTVNLETFLNDCRYQEVREELRACQHFLVDSDIIRDRQRVFNSASTYILRLSKKINYNMFSKVCSVRLKSV